MEDGGQIITGKGNWKEGWCVGGRAKSFRFPGGCFPSCSVHAWAVITTSILVPAATINSPRGISSCFFFFFFFLPPSFPPSQKQQQQLKGPAGGERRFAGSCVLG